jgi:hypothetical protein
VSPFLLQRVFCKSWTFALAFQNLLCINLGSADVHTVRLLYKFSQFVNVPHVQKHSICYCIKCNRICIFAFVPTLQRWVFLLSQKLLSCHCWR